MPHPAKPKVAKCFYCKEWFLIKFVPYYRRFSLKNDWNYWIQKNTDKKICDKKNTDKKICDNCLKKRRREIEKFIKVPRVRNALSQYISRMSS